MYRRVLRGVGAIGALAVAGWLIGGPAIAYADDTTTPDNANTATATDGHETGAASGAPSDAQPYEGGTSDTGHVTGAQPTTSSTSDTTDDPVETVGRRPSASSEGAADVADELRKQLADPVFTIANPSASHGLSFQESDAPYPIPFDGLVSEQTKAVLGSGSTSRSSKSKPVEANAAGADPYGFQRTALEVGQLRALRVEVAYGSKARPSNHDLGARGTCAPHKLLSQPSAPEGASVSGHADDTASETCSDAGEDDQPGSSAVDPMNTVGDYQPLSCYVPVLGTVPEAIRATPDEPSFSPD